MKVIFKYRIGLPGDTVSHATDPDGTVVHVGLDPNGDACVWLLVDPEAPREARAFIHIGTGTPLPDKAQPIGSFVEAPFTWHVLEVPA